MIENIRTVLQNMAVDKPGLWGQPVWYWVLAAFYAGCLVALFVLLWRTSDRARLVKRIGIMLVVISAVRAVIYVGLDYPWQVPDEHGHYEYVALTARLKRVPGLADLDPALQRDILQSMYNYRWWELGYNRTQPKVVPQSFNDDEDLKFSGVQVGDEPFLYYALLAPVSKLTESESLVSALYWMRIASALFLPLTVLAAFLCLSDVFPEKPFLILGATAFLALNPMLAYVSSGVSNNTFGTFTATLLFWSVYRLVKHGLTWRRVILIGALTLLTVLSKKSNLFVALWTGLVFVLYSWKSLQAWLLRHRNKILAAVGATLVIVVALALWPSQDAANWIQFPWPGASTRATIDQAVPEHALYILDDSIGTPRPLVQEVIRPAEAHGDIIFSIQAFSDRLNQPVRLQIFDGINTTVVTATVGQHWTPLQLKHVLTPDAWRLRVVIAADSGLASDTGALYVKNAELVDSTTGHNLLDNGSGDRQGNLLTRLATTLIMRFGVSTDWFTFLRNPFLFSGESLHWYRLGVQTMFEWFWGRFAYIAVPLAEKWYRVLFVLTIIALAGLLWAGVRNRRQGRSMWGTLSREQRRTLGYWVCALLLNLGVALFPLLRETRLWLPQGRYLFTSLLPISVLLAAGWQSWFPVRWPKLGLVVILAGFIAFDALVIAGYIIPHYYWTGL
jgi:hypothetical protein